MSYFKRLATILNQWQPIIIIIIALNPMATINKQKFPLGVGPLPF